MSEKKAKEYPSPEGTPSSHFERTVQAATPVGARVPILETVKSVPSPVGTPVSFYSMTDSRVLSPNTDQPSTVQIKPVAAQAPAASIIKTPKTYTHGLLAERRLNILSVVDSYGWAWDIASRELFRSLPGRYAGRVLDIKEFLSTPLDTSPFDVVLVYPFTDDQVLSWLNPRNTIICVEGWEWLERLRQPALQRFSFFAAYNGKIAEVIRQMLPDKTVWSLSHGVDTDLFMPAEAEPAGFTVGWVGYQSRESKRFPLAREAVARVEGATLRTSGWIGTPEYRSHERMPEFYHGLSCLLVTSSTEVHSLVVYEAMACGLPVISTRTGDTDESIVDGVSGFLLPVDCSVEQVASALTRLRDDPALRASVGAEARRTVVEKWTWDRVAETYLPVFRSVMGVGAHHRRRIGFLWWSNLYKELFSDISSPKRALERMGCEVEAFDINVFDRPDELAKLNNVDLVFTSVVPLVLEDERYSLIKSPIIFQVDGYGRSTFHDNYFNPLFPKLTERADLVTFLDMNVYEEFQRSGLKFDYNKIFFIPMGHDDLSKEVTSQEFRRPSDRVLVGSLMQESKFKEPWHYLEAAKTVGVSHPEARFLYPIWNWGAFMQDYSSVGWRKGIFGSPVEHEYADGRVERGEPRNEAKQAVRVKLSDLPNVDFLQRVPYGKVPNFMASCDVFAHYSSGDALAKTVTEAFSLSKAPITSDIVRVQGVETGKLAEVKKVIGAPMPQSYRAVKPWLRTGHMKHIYMVPRRNPSLCAEALNWAISHPREYQTMGEEAKRWSQNWFTWQNEWEAIFGLAEERKLI